MPRENMSAEGVSFTASGSKLYSGARKSKSENSKKLLETGVKTAVKNTHPVDLGTYKVSDMNTLVDS